MKAPLETETWRHNQTACSARVVWRASSRPAGLRDVAWPISQGRAIAISAGRATTCWAVRCEPPPTTQHSAALCSLCTLVSVWLPSVDCCVVNELPPTTLSHPALRTASSLTSGAAARSRAHRRPDNNYADSAQGRNSLEQPQITCLLVFSTKIYTTLYFWFCYLCTNPLTVQPTSALK